jgi:hypothetical protein
MSNPVIENAKTVSPVEASGNSNNGHSNIIKKLLIDAGISGLSENSGADEILATITKFETLTSNCPSPQIVCQMLN